MVRFIGRERELGLLREWNQGEGMWTFLERALTDPTSPLLVSAERSLAAEFPKQAIAKDVLGVIGSGERTFSNISRACGGLSAATTTRSLELLTARQAVAAELPLSTRPSRDRRYRVADPYLRFWTRFLEPALPLLERGRSDVVLRRIQEGWTSWRGRAVEPVALPMIAVSRSGVTAGGLAAAYGPEDLLHAWK
ncbi:hypothetical protein [Streptosporangium canum]|uniref:hypothetical protein n=1 Tax=Streptosporangium canum TaxID=324952 RepID=UPI0037BDE703